MRMAVQLARYPKTTHYVRYQMPKLVNEPGIVQAMKKIGGINTAQTRQALQWGSNPYIRVIGLQALGEFSPGIGSNELRINHKLVMDFEAGKRRVREARGGKVYLLGVTILHELIHWADDQNGKDRPDEEGEEFERLVYGRVIV